MKSYKPAIAADQNVLQLDGVADIRKVSSLPIFTVGSCTVQVGSYKTTEGRMLYKRFQAEKRELEGGFLRLIVFIPLRGCCKWLVRGMFESMVVNPLLEEFPCRALAAVFCVCHGS